MRPDPRDHFFGLKDVEQGDVARILGQQEPAADTALGTDDADLDQRLEDLGQKRRGNILGPADIFFRTISFFGC